MTLLPRPASIGTALIILLVLPACKKDGGTPAYVLLDRSIVRASDGDTISSKITDMWVYVNDQPAGVWESGRRVPLLSSGPSSVKLIAGVRKDGVVNDRIQYPNYATWEQQVDLVPEQTVELKPDFRYFEGTQFWLQDFEGGFQFDTLDSDVLLNVVPADGSLVGQGSFSGSVVLDTEHPKFKCVSAGDAFLVPAGTTAFLEIDYRCDMRMLVGVRYSVSGVQYDAGYLYLSPTGSNETNWLWNKVYIDLATPWNLAGAVNKHFYIAAQLENGATSGHLQLDNVDLVRP